ncbi:MAG: polyphenol oxidase family protein [Desulfarculales bacterium]|jgi:YfiH family protein|nr:polyphenol oxidase family protein [Desulfarculales bacterium]
MPLIALRPDIAPQISCAVTGRYDEQGEEFNLSSQQEPACLETNLARLQTSLGLENIVWLRQVHGERIVEADLSCRLNPPEADGIFTTAPGLGILIRQADCQALVLTAPGLAGNFHVGWRGNVLNLPGKALRFLSRRFDIAPRFFQAYIAPSLGPCCGEFVNYRKELPDIMHPFAVKENYFNLWAITAWQLINEGLPRANLSFSGLCTKSEKDRFFSHRRGDAGRFGTVAALK